MTKNTKPGDIYEIQTTVGKAYLQNLLRNSRWGILIRVSEQLFKERPSNVEDIFSHGHRFLVFFPVSAAIKQGIIEYVGSASIPSGLDRLPLFRNGTPDRDKKVKDWWLWDGEREWKIGTLSQEQRLLPILQLLNDTALTYYVENNYRPEEIY